MTKFNKYITYIHIYHLNKVTLLKNNFKKISVIIYNNDRKGEMPKLFFHYHFSLIWYISLISFLPFLIKRSGKVYSHSHTSVLFYFFNKIFFKKSFWLI